MEATKASYTALRAEPWDERRVNSRKLWADLDAKQAVAQTAATKRADEIWESALEVIQKERENKSRKTQSRKEKQVEKNALRTIRSIRKKQQQAATSRAINLIAKEKQRRDTAYVLERWRRPVRRDDDWVLVPNEKGKAEAAMPTDAKKGERKPQKRERKLLPSEEKQRGNQEKHTQMHFESKRKGCKRKVEKEPELTPKRKSDAWAETKAILSKLTSWTALALVLLLANASGTSKRVAIMAWSQDAQPRHGELENLELQQSLSSHEPETQQMRRTSSPVPVRAAAGENGVRQVGLAAIMIENGGNTVDSETEGIPEPLQNEAQPVYTCPMEDDAQHEGETPPAREGDAREGDGPKKHGDIDMTMVSKRLGTEVGTITKHTTKITIERIVDRSRSPIRVTTQTHVVEEAERIA